MEIKEQSTFDYESELKALLNSLGDEAPNNVNKPPQPTKGDVMALKSENLESTPSPDRWEGPEITSSIEKLEETVNQTESKNPSETSHINNVSPSVRGVLPQLEVPVKKTNHRKLYLTISIVVVVICFIISMKWNNAQTKAEEANSGQKKETPTLQPKHTSVPDDPLRGEYAYIANKTSNNNSPKIDPTLRSDGEGARKLLFPNNKEFDPELADNSTNRDKLKKSNNNTPKNILNSENKNSSNIEFMYSLNEIPKIPPEKNSSKSEENLAIKNGAAKTIPILSGTRIKMEMLEPFHSGIATNVMARVLENVKDEANTIVIPQGSKALIPFLPFEINQRVLNDSNKLATIILPDGNMFQLKGQIKSITGVAGLTGNIKRFNKPKVFSRFGKALGRLAGQAARTEIDSIDGGAIESTINDGLGARSSSFDISNTQVEIPQGTKFIFATVDSKER